jgi:hypothetical protein
MVQLPPFRATLDSIRTHSHVVVKEVSADSTWRADEFDAQDTIMASGTFKDQKLNIPHGIFKFYEYSSPYLSITYDYRHHKADSVIVPPKNILKSEGHFFNGEKVGLWATFDALGKSSTENYDHGQVNGLSETYNTSTGKVFVRGNYINGIREGNWNMISFEGDTISTEIYKHNKVVKTASFLNKKKFTDRAVTSPHPNYNFIRYLNTQLSKMGVSQSGEKTSLYTFTIDTTGHIVEPTVITRNRVKDNVNLEVDIAIIDAMFNAPPWIPGEQNKQMVKITTALQLNLKFDKNGISVSQVSYSDIGALKNPYNTFNSFNSGNDHRVAIQ